jgi:hypothetical protein
MPMKFAIADLIWTTTTVAILFAILRTGYDGCEYACFVFTLLQFALPFGIIFSTIAFADQRGQTLDHTSLPGWQFWKRIWLLSIVCTIVVWILLFSIPPSANAQF